MFDEEQIIELKEFLRNHLSIEIEQSYESFGLGEHLIVRLLLDGDEISKDYCSLPSGE